MNTRSSTESALLINRACDIVGSQAELARRIGVKPQMITKWLRGKSVAGLRAVAIERATGGEISRAQLRPDLFADTALPLITPPPPNRRQVPNRRTTSERRQAPTRRTEEATPGRRTGGERRQGERRAAAQEQDQAKPPKPAPSTELRTGLSSDEACPFGVAQESPEPRRRGEADRAA